MKVLVVNGPNLNMLGKREPDKYGKTGLKEITASLRKTGDEAGVQILDFQSNTEGAIVDFIQENGAGSDYLIINPAAYTHTSVAIRDAILAVEIPVVEVHLSNIFCREEFRHKSMISDIADGVISGLGAYGYNAALEFILQKGKK